MKVLLLTKRLPVLNCLVLNLAVIPGVFISGELFKYNRYGHETFVGIKG
jgi:hypothetical protein